MTDVDSKEQKGLRDVYKYDTGRSGFKRAAAFLLFWAALLATIGGLFLWDMFGQ